MSQISCVLEAGNHLGETPIWAPTEEVLYWVNCEQPAELHRWSPDSGKHDVWSLPKRAGGFVPKEKGGFLVVLADGLYDFDTQSGDLDLRVASSLPDHVKLHECHCDRQGRFWVGSYDHHYPADRDAKDGFWFRLDGTALTPVIDNVTISNGLAFSPDGRTMYAANARANSVEAFDLDPATGSISNKRTFLTLSRDDGFCDGATVDSEGGYWLAAVGSGTLRRYLPDGSLDRIVRLPFSNPTKPAFGGLDMGTLFITSTRMAINTDSPGYANNGGLFAFRPGEHGIAETPLRG